MPRPKTFDPATALDRATELFWRAGFAQTSYDQLVAGTQASRYGLYASFGGKTALLTQALERYAEQVVKPLRAPLEEPDAALAEVRRFLENVLAMHERYGRRGCLNCNTALEIGQSRSASARRIARHFAEMRALLVRALGNARRRGTLRRDLDVEDGARYLVSTVAGSFLLARAGMPPEQTAAFLRTAAATLAEPGQ
jgi:TetR/AcrR family transcriptional regulator, transcriptional repressor for nem operon